MYDTAQQYHAELAYRREQIRRDLAVRRQRARLKSRRPQRMGPVIES